MSSRFAIRQEGSGRAQHTEQSSEAETIEERADLRASVEQQSQATVDYADEQAHEGRLFGQTLEAQEKRAAEEWEIERTNARVDKRQVSSREERTRREAAQGSRKRRCAFQKRAASVDPWMDPDVSDPRERLSQEELATVNREAARMAERLNGWTSAAIGRRLAEAVLDGVCLASAVVRVFEELQTAPGHVIPIDAIEEVSRREVSIEGEVSTLWNADSNSINQVGLIEDESGTIKFTAWAKSEMPVVAEGERVRIYGAAKNWYQGRCSIALTGRSWIERLDRTAEY